MAQQLFAVDGTYYDVAVTSFKTTANIMDTEKAGRSTTGSMIRDIIGTFIPVELELTMRRYDLTAFSNLVRQLRQPVEYVSLTVIDLDGTLTFNAYVSKVEYEFQGFLGGVRRWGKLKVVFTPIDPNIRPG